MRNILFILIILSSCSTVHKTSSTEKVRVDSSTTHTEIDNTLKKVDSVVKKEEKIATGYEVDTSTGRTISIKFDTSKSPSGRSIIIKDSSGILSIDPGGRTITDISVKNKATGRKAGSTSQTTSSAVDLKKTDSRQQEAANSTDLSRDTKKKDTTKEKTGFPWIWVAVTGVLSLICYLAYKYFNKPLIEKIV